MAAVNVTSVQVLNNPNTFFAPLQFEISYECHCELQEGALAPLRHVGTEVTTLEAFQVHQCTACW